MPARPAADLLEELLRLLGRQSKRVSVPVLVAAITIAVLARDNVPAWKWAGWTALVTAMLAVRMLVLPRLAEKTGLPVSSRIHVAIALSAANGIVHALSLAFFPYIDDIDRAIQTVVLIGMSTGAVVTTAGYAPIFLCYLLPVNLPLALLWFATSSSGVNAEVSILFGFLILLNAAILASIARDSYRLFRESFEIRSQQAALNEQLQAALEAAEAANRAKTRFLASASHDLRQPFQSLILDASNLTSRPLDSGSHQVALRIEAMVHALSELLDKLLHVSKLEAGIVEVKNISFDVTEIVRAMQDEFTAHASDKGIALVIDVPETMVVESDPILLTQLLRNLVSNAVKYTESGEVHVTAHDEAGECILIVRDTGPGIPLEEQDNIFQEYYRGDSSRRNNEGLGLGLTIVDKTRRLLGIPLAFRSGPGQGTRFELRIPLVARPAAPQHRRRTRAAGLRGLNVLVVDDEGAVRNSLRESLETAGCNVSIASGTEEALAQVQRHAPDLLLTDWRLRGQDTGFAVIDAVRRELPQLPAILITGDTAPDRLRQADAAGLPLLHKPVTAARLQATILEVLGNSHGAREPPFNSR